MKFALLGWHADVLPLVRAISARSGHQLVVAAEVPREALSSLLAIAPGVRLLNDWQAALGTRELDAYLVAGADDSVLEAARQIASDGRTIVLCPCAAQGSAFVYELTLVHDDNRVPLIPVPGLAAHPLVARLRSEIGGGSLGQLVLLRIERAIPGLSHAPLLTRQQVDTALLGDVALLRSLGGNYDRVTAVHSGSNGDSVSLATVTLGGTELAEASWTARCGEPSWTLTATGTTGSATLKLAMPELTTGELATPERALQALATPARATPAPTSRERATQPVEPDQSGTLQITRADEALEVADDGTGLGDAQLDAVLERLESSESDWAEMTRTFESAEATHTSLRRRRTIDLFFETTSERSIFKSQMTAAGCGLLLLTLSGLVAFLLLGAFLDSRTLAQKNAAGQKRVIQTTEFDPGRTTLNRVGQDHLSKLARQMELAPQAILVMPESEQSAGSEDVANELNTGRVNAVIDRLTTAGHAGSAAYVELAAVPNPLLVLLLVVLRYLWIAPLVLFLALQTLIVVTRPAS